MIAEGGRDAFYKGEIAKRLVAFSDKKGGLFALDDFAKHTLIAGHVAARSGDALARSVSERLAAVGVRHAATGLAAAWQLTRFAGFRLTTFYVDSRPSAEVVAGLGFHAAARGANLWLIVPNDEGVFQGAESQDGIPCVHPIQTYLDLGAHPERAAEAAKHLRDRYMNWSPHA